MSASSAACFALAAKPLYNSRMTDSPSHYQTLDNSALYAACGSNNPDEQTAAYRELWRYLYQVAAYMTRSQPDGDALAQDCAQRALLRVHEQYISCQEPLAFRAWARRIVSNLVIDELRRQKRWQLLPEPEQAAELTETRQPGPETAVLLSLTAVSLRHLLQQAPISDRSRRLVVGRYLDDLPDEILADTESELSSSPVLPSHVQVTRAKNIAKLRQWPLLMSFLQETA
ncbi:MAG: RNA polymerase sigma factor [Chloroflexi bacterium]|nr:RNA polymerase sigma factor [Chloroflexota bacterium]